MMLILANKLQNERLTVAKTTEQRYEVLPIVDHQSVERMGCVLHVLDHTFPASLL